MDQAVKLGNYFEGNLLIALDLIDADQGMERTHNLLNWIQRKHVYEFLARIAFQENRVLSPHA